MDTYKETFLTLKKYVDDLFVYTNFNTEIRLYISFLDKKRIYWNEIAYLGNGLITVKLFQDNDGDNIRIIHISNISLQLELKIPQQSQDYDRPEQYQHLIDKSEDN